ncbi:MAG: hypothetical protein PHS59_10430 [Paludibacter sp.]|nr:hypothetical protein [Paludibacter sp.]
MNLKKNFLLLFISLTTVAMSEDSAVSFKFYGFVRNDIFYNSRQNVESTDGAFHLFPKPVELLDGKDKNAVSQAEMLSVATRLGMDITGSPILGAKSSAKIEADFSGFSQNFYVMRLRQAYTKLNWSNTELLIGQTWHPLFGSVMPSLTNLNVGAPFQPFNRSPQVRLKQNLWKTISLTAAASYQMQNLSQGPIGSSPTYLKNSLLPDLFIGAEGKTSHWTSGIGFDVKTIKPSVEKLTSSSAIIYTQYVNKSFQIKAKSLWGGNLSDYLMLSGYGITDSINGNPTYTNFNISSSWLNVVYGSTFQAGIFLGLSKNFGTNKLLAANTGNIFTAYGYGYYQDTQQLLDRLIRIQPYICYNFPNLKVGLEYDLTSAQYGTLKSDGLVSSPYNINNTRVVLSVSYLF